MSVQHIRNVSICGIAAAVPQRKIEVADCQNFKSVEDREKHIKNVGVERIRCHQGDMTTGDLCQAAALRLMADLHWSPEDVDLLVFVSQSMDYVLPATSCVLHGKLGLREDCTCFDVGLGCSGWVYGLSVVAGMMQGGAFKKAILLAGDVKDVASRVYELPLFGDAGTATALVYDEAAKEMIIGTYTDGKGYEAIIRRVGASRCPITADALLYREDSFGHVHRAIDTEMDGAAVFIFGISTIPKAIKNLLNYTEQAVDDVDFFLFHQANLMMNEQIRKKCKIPEEKCPYSLRDFGNNSSASIPLTMVTQLRERLSSSGEHRLVVCGFGVGLSWATASINWQGDAVISNLVEV